MIKSYLHPFSLENIGENEFLINDINNITSLKTETKNNTIDNSECESDCDKCKTCKYKDFFYAQTHCLSEPDTFYTDKESQILNKTTFRYKTINYSK